MKKKLLALFLCAVMAASVAACGGSGESSSSTSTESTAGDVAGMIVSGEDADSADEEEEPSPTFAYQVLQGEFDTLYGCLYGEGSMHYVVLKQGDDGSQKYVIMDENLKEVPDISFDYSPFRGKDYVCFYNETKDGFRNVIYDCDLNVVLDWQSKEMCLDFYDDGIATFLDFAHSSKDALVLAYMDVAKGTTLIEPYKDFANYGSASNFYDGCAMIRGRVGDDLYMRTYRMGSDGMYEEIKMTTESGKEVPLYAYSSSNIHPYYGMDGWMIFKFPDIQADHYGMAKTDTKYGFYNLNTKQIVPCPSEDNNWRMIIPDGTTGYMYEYRGLALEMSKSTEDKVAMNVFNIETGVMGTDTFKSFAMSGFGRSDRLALVSNQEGKWGWYDKELNQVGDWYDDASTFMGGYALINKDGSEYIVNNKIEIMSDAIEGASASTLGETEDKVYFAISGKGEGAKIKILEITK